MSSRPLEFKPLTMVVSLRGVKAASRRLLGGLRASLDPSTLKDAAHGVSPNRRKFRDLWTGALSGIGNNRTESPGKASRRNGTVNRLKNRLAALFCAPQEHPRCFASEERLTHHPQRVAVERPIVYKCKLAFNNLLSQFMFTPVNDRFQVEAHFSTWRKHVDSKCFDSKS